MKNLLFGTIFLGLASLGYAQSSDCNKSERLSSVEVSQTDQVYLDEVSDETFSNNVVYTLEQKASRYDIKEHPSFNVKGYGKYDVQFDMGKSKIVATYDQNGKIISAKENFKDLLVPVSVRESVDNKYPNWTLKSTAYTVNYNGQEAKKRYMVQVEKDGVKKRLNFDHKGNLKE